MTTYLTTFLIIILGIFILGYLIRAILFHRWNKHLKQDLLNRKDPVEESDRISIVNIFFDLGANKNAVKALIDLKIFDAQWKIINVDSGIRLEQYILESGGYGEFINKVRRYYGESPEQDSPPFLSSNYQVSSQLESITKSKVNYETIRLSVEDVKKKIKSAGPAAIGEMVGIPIAEIKVAKQLPGLAERYYRINVQSKHIGNPYLKTAEDLMSNSGTQLVGGVAGGVAGFALGDFLGDFISGDDASIEGVVFGLAFGLGGAILSGKLFKNIGKWWNTRKLEKLRKEYEGACYELYYHICDQKNYQLFNSNMNAGIDFWTNKLDQMVNDYEELDPNSDNGIYFSRLYHITFDLIEKIHKQIFASKEKFVNELNMHIEEGEYSKAVQTILAQEKILLREIKGLNPYKNRIRSTLKAVEAEYSVLKKKGVLETN